MTDKSTKLRKEISIKAAELGRLLYLYEEFCDDNIDVNVVYDYGSTLYDLMCLFECED